MLGCVSVSFAFQYFWMFYPECIAYNVCVQHLNFRISSTISLLAEGHRVSRLAICQLSLVILSFLQKKCITIAY